MGRLKIWLTISCLTVILALAGCAAPQTLQPTDTFNQERWNSISVPQPSGENTTWGLWQELQGAG